MSCDWKSASAYAQARRLLLLSLLLAGVTLLLAATASAASQRVRQTLLLRTCILLSYDV